MNYSLKLKELVEIAKTKKNLGNFSRKYRSTIEKNTEFLPKTASIRERLYYVEFDLINPVKCSNCKNYPVWDWKILKYKKYCSRCVKSAIETINKSRYTKLIKYDNENYCNLDKIKQTKLAKYGHENYCNPDKIKQTKLTRYGDKNYNNQSKIRKVCLSRYGNENYKNLELRNRTNLIKYGNICSLHGNKIKEKTKQTKLAKYGHENYCNPNRIRKTKLKRYNDKNYNNINKIKQTKLARYNNENYNNISKILKTHKIKYNGIGWSSNELLKKYIRTINKNYHKRFLEISKNIHDDQYKYFKLKQSHDLIDIECPIHGIFQLPMYYHTRGIGCRQCFPKDQGFSQKAIKWLNYISETKNIYIQHAMNEGEYKIPGTKYHVDGHCKDNNTVYEFLGDFWHGNPDLFKNTNINPILNITYGEAYNNTMSRLEEIRSLGYNIEYIWENDYEKISG